MIWVIVKAPAVGSTWRLQLFMPNGTQSQALYLQCNKLSWNLNVAPLPSSLLPKIPAVQVSRGR